MLLDLTETYAVLPDLLPGGGLWLNPGEEAWALQGEPIPASVPDELWKQGLLEFKDSIKLIVSTEAGDATVLQQHDLDISFEPAATRSICGSLSTLDRLMQRVQTRHVVPKSQSADRVVDWTTSQIAITTLRPLDSAPVNETVDLSAQVTLVGHAELKANARLSTSAVASRSVGLRPLPPILRDHPGAIRPLQFSESRGGDPGLSVLELTEVDSATTAAVTPEQPLVLRARVSLEQNEHVLPVAYDGEFWLPLGHARRDASGVELVIDRLPTPIVDSRSLLGSIRIFFHKVVAERLGTSYNYPLLAAVAHESAGISYIADADQVRSRIAAAKRILLYVHGIIGDTRGMSESAFAGSETQALARRYDLILAFDYENINTSIEQTARDLKQRLQTVGLSAGHGKTLDVAAHSMGGLVARWFIEREGGNAVIQRLVMLGTPNGGSPWPTVQAWATAVVAIGLSSLAAIAWPVQALGGLLSAIETVDNTLDQMQPGSKFLTSLAASADPIPYTILAGNTSLIPAALENGAESSLLARLLARLTPDKLLHKTTA